MQRGHDHAKSIAHTCLYFFDLSSYISSSLKRQATDYLLLFCIFLYFTLFIIVIILFYFILFLQPQFQR